MHQISTKIYNNIVQLNKSALCDWQKISHYQMDEGSCSATNYTINIEQFASINICCCNSTILTQGISSKDKITFIVINNNNRKNKTTINMQEVKKNMLFCFRENSEISLILQPKTLWFSFQIARKELEQFKFDIDKFDHTAINGNNICSKLSYLKIENLIQDSHKILGTLNQNTFYKKILNKYILEFIHANKLNEINEDVFALKVFRYIEKYSDYKITMHSLSKEIGKSERTLQRLFMKKYDTTIQNFIKIYRLHQVYTKFLDKTKTETISSIAFDYGFTHLGRFSQEYKKFFGELPSTTYKV